MTTCIIVDDERHSSGSLQILLKSFFSEIEILKVCQNGDEGIEAVHELKPDLIYLDISMPNMDGFEMLAQLSDCNFEVIFTTAHDNYAIQAFKVNAIDYLLKPIIKEEFIEATNKAIERISLHSLSGSTGSELNLINLLQYLRQDQIAINRLSIPTSQGFQLIDVVNILYISSDGNYSTIQLTSGESILVTRQLKVLETQLKNSHCLRIHRNTLVNLAHVDRYIKGEGGYIVLANGVHLDVSRRKKNDLLLVLDTKRKLL